MSALSGLSLDDFLGGMLSLPPPGRAFSGDPDTAQAIVFTPPADALTRVHEGAMRLLDIEADPGQTVDLLPDWEREFGLPDPCTAAGATMDQRRRALLAKIAALGGQSRAYFIRVAAALGYAIAIEEFSPFWLGTPLGSPLCGPGWQWVWNIHAPDIAVRFFRLGLSALGEPFSTVSHADLECRLRELAPAHTFLLFIYS